MKIALVTPIFPPYRGGMGNAAFNFYKGLQKLGHDITVFTPRYSKAETLDDSKIQYLKPLVTYGNAAVVPQLLWRLQGYDVVYVHLPFIGAEKALLWFKILHPKTKLVVHYQMDLIGTGVKRIFFWLYSQTALRLLLLIASTIVVSSKDYVAHSQIRSSFKKSKVVAIPNGIGHTENNETGSTINKMKKPFVLFVGGMDKAHHFKGVEQLIKAWQKLHKRLPDAHLILIGNGGQRAHFEKLASAIQARRTIHFKSNVDDLTLRSYYENAHVTVLPSTTRGEAFGMVLLESMAAGTPVIASNLPGVRLLAKEGNGWTFTIGSVDELARTLEKALSFDTSTMSDDVVKFAKKFEWDLLCEDLEKVLKK